MKLTKLEAGIKRDEGYKKFVYQDTAGNDTIGIGLNLRVGIDKDLAVLIMRCLISKIREDLSYRFNFWNGLSRNRQDVLINMAFNMGVKRLLGFKKMLAAMEDENWSRARNELLDSSAARELPNRYGRLAEKMLNG